MKISGNMVSDWKLVGKYFLTEIEWENGAWLKTSGKMVPDCKRVGKMVPDWKNSAWLKISKSISDWFYTITAHRY